MGTLSSWRTWVCRSVGRGYALQPLYKSVPFAARKDAKLYELLALTDAIREARPREAKLTVQELRILLTQREYA